MSAYKLTKPVIAATQGWVIGGAHLHGHDLRSHGLGRHHQVHVSRGQGRRVRRPDAGHRLAHAAQGRDGAAAAGRGDLGEARLRRGLREQGRAARRGAQGGAAHGRDHRQLGAAGDPHPARLRQPDAAARVRPRSSCPSATSSRRSPPARTARKAPPPSARSGPPSSRDVDHMGKLLLVGCGKMGGAMLDGWLSRGLAAADVIVAEPVEALRPKQAGAARGRLDQRGARDAGDRRAGGEAADRWMRCCPT